jgi:hypothetical protein
VHGAVAVQLQRFLTAMALLVRVADLTTRVVSTEPGVALAVSGPGSRFLVPDGPADVDIEVTRVPHLTHPEGEKLFDSGVVWKLYRDRQGFVFSFTSGLTGPAPYRVAGFDPSFACGQVWLNLACLGNHEVFTPLEYPLDELLMINLLARGRGVEVHGCGVIDRDGAGYLFAGHSGAGKSTTARLWHDRQATILSDDRIILRLRGDEVWMYGTPWHGEEGFASPGSARLARIFFLEHGRDNRASPVCGAGAAARLFARSFPPFHDRAGLDFTMELLDGIVDRVPCCDLAFVPDGRSVSFVRAHG